MRIIGAWYDEYFERVGNDLSPKRLAFEIQSRRHVIRAMQWVAIGVLLGFGIVAFATLSLGPSRWFDGFAIFGASLLAATALGGLFGFLFGIPKTGLGAPVQSKPEEAKDAAGTAKPNGRVNTNLEEVSDWLTKLILGAGLTQIGALWTLFVDLSRRIGERGLTEPNFGGVVAGGLILYGLIVGFLSGYILTRLYLSNVFLLADSFDAHEDVEKALGNAFVPPPPTQSSATISGGDDNPPPAPSVAPSVAAQVSAVPVEEIKDTDNLVKAARVHWTLGKPDNLHKALEAYRLALAREPARGDIRAEYAQRLIERKRYADAADALTRALRDMRAANASKEMILETARALAYAQLYLSKPESFERALATIEETSREPGFVLDIDWRIKRLCANGQKLRHLGPTLNEKSRAELREAILADVRDIIEKSPRYTRYLQGLIEPLNRPPGSVDDDLEALRGDAELRTLVGLPPLDQQS